MKLELLNSNAVPAPLDDSPQLALRSASRHGRLSSLLRGILLTSTSSFSARFCLGEAAGSRIARCKLLGFSRAAPTPATDGWAHQATRDPYGCSSNPPLKSIPQNLFSILLECLQLQRITSESAACGSSPSSSRFRFPRNCCVPAPAVFLSGTAIIFNTCAGSFRSIETLRASEMGSPAPLLLLHILQVGGDSELARAVSHPNQW